MTQDYTGCIYSGVSLLLQASASACPPARFLKPNIPLVSFFHSHHVPCQPRGAFLCHCYFKKGTLVAHNNSVCTRNL